MSDLASLASQARAAYLKRITSHRSHPWWDVVILTAASEAQARWYESEIRRAQQDARLPCDVEFVVVPDPSARRVGSGGATLWALRALGQVREDWWAGHRVLMIHCGGDARRIPQYSHIGKLFAAVPVPELWGDQTVLLDEFLALSTAWAEQMHCGLLVASGDVILLFDARQANWAGCGVTGIAMRQPLEISLHHGIYLAGDDGAVRGFLQKPSVTEARAAGAVLPGDAAALDTGLLRFAPALAAGLSTFAVRLEGADLDSPLDLYDEMIRMLLGSYEAHEHGRLRCGLASFLRNARFNCSLVDGEFRHFGTTSQFSRFLTAGAPGALLVDSVLSSGAELAAGSIAIECRLDVPVKAGRGAILHGLEHVIKPLTVPDETVVHELPVKLPDGTAGFVRRTYGTADDPKAPLSSATWLGRPILESLAAAGLDADTVWAGIPFEQRCLWNARLFPLNSVDHTMDARRLSLCESTEWADLEALARARAERSGFASIARAVEVGGSEDCWPPSGCRWERTRVSISAPVRVDLAGGWTDTPPFCQDCGGAVLNIAVDWLAGPPIRVHLQRLEQPLIRCVSEETGDVVEYRVAEDVPAAPAPGSVFALTISALRLAGIIGRGRALGAALTDLGGGLEVRTSTDVPHGSGLGTSSILAAALLQALAEMLAAPIDQQALIRAVLRLEQQMTTGGGWQDQAGGLFPGAKLLTSYPGLRQSVKVELLPESVLQTFSERFVLYDTGLRRIAKNLVRHVVGRYLAKEPEALAALDRIKETAIEMSQALRAGDWESVGYLMDRGWELNQLLDPHTSNEYIHSLVEMVRPLVLGAKLAGAGGGGFLLLLARGPEEANALRERLPSSPGAVHEFRIAREGLRVIASEGGL